MSYTDYRNRLRRAMPYPIQREIEQHCGDITRRLPGGVVRAALPERCVLALDKTLVSRAVARLDATRELDQDLTRHIADLDQKQGAFRNYQRRAREMRMRLESFG